MHDCRLTNRALSVRFFAFVGSSADIPAQPSTSLSSSSVVGSSSSVVVSAGVVDGALVVVIVIVAPTDAGFSADLIRANLGLKKLTSGGSVKLNGIGALVVDELPDVRPNRAKRSAKVAWVNDESVDWPAVVCSTVAPSVLGRGACVVSGC